MQQLNNGLIQMRYYDTYSVAHVVHNTLAREAVDFMPTVYEFFGDQYCRFIEPYRRWSSLHQYIFFALEVLEREQIPKIIPRELRNVDELPPWAQHEGILPIEDALRAHGISHTSFRSWAQHHGVELDEAGEDHFCEYHDDLNVLEIVESGRKVGVDGPRIKLYEHITEEVFFLMFPNRGCLLELNDWIAGEIRDVRIAELHDDERRRFASDGVLKRVSPPQWARRAVYFRERGRCAFCGVDLSGLSSVYSSKHFDHIVPLAQGGINDVTNLQLLCGNCNLRKGHGEAQTSPFVERWFDPEADGDARHPT
ncbi:MAG: HNH endonuclease signature motif containing protein [Deltaproteobacteria bacterium]